MADHFVLKAKLDYALRPLDVDPQELRRLLASTDQQAYMTSAPYRMGVDTLSMMLPAMVGPLNSVQRQALAGLLPHMIDGLARDAGAYGNRVNDEVLRQMTEGGPVRVIDGPFPQVGEF